MRAVGCGGSCDGGAAAAGWLGSGGVSVAGWRGDQLMQTACDQPDACPPAPTIHSEIEGIRQWMINRCTPLVMMDKLIPYVNLKY